MEGAADPVRDIDRKALRTLVGRFRASHEARLAALPRALPTDHRILLEALPVLLHTNHAALPGFVDFDTPAGIDGYTPARNAIVSTRKLALSFTLERFRERSTRIQSLFLMFETGSSSAAPQVEGWVITQQDRGSLLEEKLAAIATYARQLGLALHFRVVDPLTVRSRDNNATRSGDANNLGKTPTLLLERFFREGVLVAGRYPIWWLVPPTFDPDHTRYAERLRSQRFIGTNETFDLGSVVHVPAHECAEAALACFDQCLNAPYVHLPELTLIESYLDGAPLLARRWKQQMHDAGAQERTPDLLRHTLLEGYLQTRDTERLELLRRCFVETHSEDQVTALAGDRGWSPQGTTEPTGDAAAPFHARQLEDRRVSRALGASLAVVRRALSGDATNMQLAQTLLERIERIEAQLDRLDSPEEVHGFRCAGLLPRRVELELSGNRGAWLLTEGTYRLIETERLTNVGLFLHEHRLTLDSVRVSTVDVRLRLSRVLSALATALPTDGSDDATMLLIVNAEESPSGVRTADGDALVSNWDDALDFSGFRATLVESIDCIVRRAGAAHLTHRAGNDGLRSALVAALGASAPQFHCVDHHRQRIIEERLTDILKQARHALDQHACFVFGLSSELVAIVPGPPVHALAFQTVAELADYLHGLAAPGAAHLDAANPRLQEVLGRVRTSATELARPAAAQGRP